MAQAVGSYIRLVGLGAKSAVLGGAGVEHASYGTWRGTWHLGASGGATRERRCQQVLRLAPHAGRALRPNRGEMCDERMASAEAVASMDIDNADTNGEQTEQFLRGDASVVRARRAEGTANSRARAAVQAALDKIRWCNRPRQ